MKENGTSNLCLKAFINVYVNFLFFLDGLELVLVSPDKVIKLLKECLCSDFSDLNGHS